MNQGLKFTPSANLRRLFEKPVRQIARKSAAAVEDPSVMSEAELQMQRHGPDFDINAFTDEELCELAKDVTCPWACLWLNETLVAVGTRWVNNGKELWEASLKG